MRHDRDFLDHVTARWPGLVRSLVLIGCPEEHAERVARSGLARSHRGWARARRHDDLDAHVYACVLEAADRQLGRGRGPTPVQTMRVLHFVAGLGEQQVAEVLGVPVQLVDEELESADEASFHAAADRIGVPAAPTTEVLVEAAALRRRRRVVVLASVGVAATVVGLGSWWGGRPEPAPEPAPPVVTQQENLAGIAWWANNVLYLDHVSVVLPRVEDLVEVQGGVVVGDRRGNVTFVDDEGTFTTLGQKRPAVPLVASAEQGWVAWVDPRDGSPLLVVHDLASNETLAQRELPGSAPRPGDAGRGESPDRPGRLHAVLRHCRR